jgi:hypothetical protein
MKKILSIFIIIATVSILLISNNTIAGPAWVPPGGAKPSTECNAEAYYADGTLCHDTDDDKLYLGTGAAVLQILSATSIGTIATQNSDNATITGGNVTGLTNLGAANLTVTGTANVTGATWTGLTPKFTFVDGSSSANLTAIQLSGTVLGNPTQSGNVTHVLPAIETGLQFDTILGLTAAFYFRLDPNANDSIYLDGVSCTDGKYIELTTVTVGDAISCRAMKTGASTYDWACYTAKGAWACE